VGWSPLSASWTGLWSAISALGRSVQAGAADREPLDSALAPNPSAAGDRWLHYAPLKASNAFRIVVTTFPQVAVVRSHEAKCLAQ
jgi:hypothetical protein